MKKQAATLFVTALVIFILASCAPSGQGVYAADGFVLTLLTDKEVYEAGEPVLIWAELEYVGEGEWILIHSTLQPIGFSVTDGVDYFWGTLHETLAKNTRIEKGEVHRFYYDHRQMGRDQYELILPAGTYTVRAYEAFWVEFPSDAGDPGERDGWCEKTIRVR